MLGRLENQKKTESHIDELLVNSPKEVTNYYLNFRNNKEFRSCLVYIQRIRMFLMWYQDVYKLNSIKDIDVTKIDDVDIARFLKSIEEKTKKDGTVTYTSFSYRKTSYSALNSFFSFLEMKKLIDKNPLHLIEREKRKDKVKHVHLQKEDLDKIRRTIEKGAGSDKAKSYQKALRERDLAIFDTFVFTGMRESALCEIDISRIDFENNILEVTDKERKINTYTIPPKLKESLLLWIEKRNEILGDDRMDALFISSRKQRISQRSVIDLINKYTLEAIDKKVSPHRLRAAYCNILFKKTKDKEFVRIAMKHNQVSTTEIYLEEQDEKLINDKVADILENIF